MAVTRTDTLRSHWQPEVPDYLTWHMLFDDQPAFQAIAQSYQQALIGIDGIDIVLTRWLRLTLQGVGSVDEISAREVDNLADAARERLARMHPFPLTFQPAEVEWEGVVMTAVPGEPVQALGGRYVWSLRAATRLGHTKDRR
jgi:hypothetical protein